MSSALERPAPAQAPVDRRLVFFAGRDGRLIKCSAATIMKEASTTTAVIAAITELQKEGCPVANRPEEMAGIAVRRWFSSERRGVKQSDLDARIRDLAKSLVAQFEANPKLVGPLMRDYECIAAKVAGVLFGKAESARRDASGLDSLGGSNQS
jgi:hypothetical protein